jgi:hypothetical protein
MAEKLDENETVTLEEVVVSHAYEMMALITILEKKGILTRSEIIAEIQKMRRDET